MRYVLMAALMALAGCESPKTVNAVAEDKQCEAQHPAVVGGYVTLQECLNDVTYRIAPTNPAGALYRSTAISVMKKVDAGQMSIEDARVILDDLVYKISQDMAASRPAVALVAPLAPTPAQRPYLAPSPPPQQTFCYRAGGTVQCNSY